MAELPAPTNERPSGPASPGGASAAAPPVSPGGVSAEVPAASPDGASGPPEPTLAMIPAVPEANPHPGRATRESVTVPATRTEESPRVPQRPVAARVPEGAWLGGVCSGLSQHLGWPVMVLRVGFVVLGMMNLIGCLLYAACWLLLPPQSQLEQYAPGLESAARTNKRTVQNKPRRKADAGAVLALTLFAAGLIWLVQASGHGLSQRVFWPIAFACAGVALVWRTADTAQDNDWKKETEGKVWLAPFVARGRLLTVSRVVLGFGLVGAAVSWVIASQTGLEQLPRTLAMCALALAGCALVVAPWAYRSQVALRLEREEKVRAHERADMAAHLHDSVLQTLALIQKRSADPKTVASLARKQERELRTWLYGDVIKEKTVKAALTAAAAEVDDERGIPVEVVCVGDCDLDDDLEAMIRAAREAMMNAAKHSGSAKIDVYAEIGDEIVEVFVKDRGKGFDLDSIADDRMGVKGSIIGRMERHGGSAKIRTSPETGTEVRLEMNR